MADKFAPDITASTAAADNITAIRENRQAAGHYEAAGAEAGKAVGGAVSFLGTNVLSGYKGYLEAGQEREVSQVIDDAKTQISALPASSAAADNTMAAGGDNPAGQFKSETDKLYAAYKQGILTQGDLNLRVRAVTKKYSAIMPG